jgi:hypothetical protein
MAVFDKGGFADRLKRKPERIKEEKSQDWEDGFLVGYKSALERYIKADSKT